jgi:hypothetical protein
VPTGTASQDRTIEQVYRQGFTFPGARKVSMHARVTVYEYDSALANEPDPAPAVPPAADDHLTVAAAEPEPIGPPATS